MTIAPAPATPPSGPPPFALSVPITIEAIVRPEPTGGYSAEVPALPGCYTCGDDLDQLRDNLIEAAEGWLAGKRELIDA